MKEYLPVDGCEECELFGEACVECVMYGEAQEKPPAITLKPQRGLGREVSGNSAETKTETNQQKD